MAYKEASNKASWKIWLVFLAISQSINISMTLWTFPYISSQSEGQTAFDMRHFGYSVLDAQDFLAKISIAGIAFYKTIQLPLDIPYPAIMCLFILVTFVNLQKILQGGTKEKNRTASRLTLVSMLIPIIGMLGDYCENACIFLMLSNPLRASDMLIRFSSVCTIIKSASTMIGWSIAIVMATIALVSICSRRREARQACSR